MSVEAPIKQVDNWFIGEDKTLRFYVTTGADIEASARAATGATSISVKALTEALTSGGRVRFPNKIVATLTANAAVGDTSLAVSATAGVIANGAVGRKVQDVTGYTMEWILRKAPGASTVDVTKTPTINDAANGVVDVAVADADTLSLTPGNYYHTIRKTNDGDESVLAFGEAVLRQATTR